MLFHVLVIIKNFTRDHKLFSGILTLVLTYNLAWKLEASYYNPQINASISNASFDPSLKDLEFIKLFTPSLGLMLCGYQLCVHNCQARFNTDWRSLQTATQKTSKIHRQISHDLKVRWSRHISPPKTPWKLIFKSNEKN